ncbi:hypothetical protein H6503_04150 [Candidatus Woesearchaeota archaeon]|nr:hypothetical protein [Candidatus Woesearchaeota archaeon]
MNGNRQIDPTSVILSQFQETLQREYAAVERLVQMANGCSDCDFDDVEDFVKTRELQSIRLEGVAHNLERCCLEGMQPDELQDELDAFDGMCMRVIYLEELAREYNTKTLNCAKGVVEQYRALGKELRHIITDEVRTGNYSELKCPTKKVKHGMDLADMKLRVNVLPRFPSRTGNGKRNLNVGYSETILCLYGMLVDPTDYTKGVDIVSAKDTFRWVVGAPFSTIDPFDQELSNLMYEKQGAIAGYLMEADYTSFVRHVLSTADTSFKMLKDLAMDLELQ